VSCALEGGGVPQCQGEAIRSLSREPGVALGHVVWDCSFEKGVVGM